MTEDQRQRLRGIKTFNQLLAFLREDLDWPIEEVDDEDDLTFDWSDDLGLKESERVGIKAIKQLRPMESGQPWGIFFVDFEKKRLPIVILRRILNALVMKKRAGANRAERAAWKQHDLLFISAYGEQDDRQLTFAHFSEPTGELVDNKPTLRVLGWDDEDTNLKLDHVADVLHERLTWPKDTGDLPAWRNRWSGAFELRPHQVIDTAKELAMRLAELAKRIRNRALLVLPLESESGPLRKLMKGFKTALIHDLTDDSFADMYAQTITYGLFSAAVSRTVPGAGTAVVQDNVVDMIPVTNPFLKEMLQSFLKAGGRKGKLDFDELGIQEVVDLLNDPHTRLDAVLRDFGNKTRGEDPVIHFYEHFLGAYNKKLKVQRGVFYTPQPVVSYIVRSVHELLQTEFGLADGLADTTTWGEMLEKHPGMLLPPFTDEPGEKRTISSEEPFVQILDPATGTATFLVEVIEVIHRTLAVKWKVLHLTPDQQRDAWNDYVPEHLLPRLHAFELMMAPYAIAHMKIGLKLAETGYRFGSEERARIYLTNALEPWVRQLPLVGFDALAHEAAAVNDIKRHKRFTVIIGNPPYSNFGQLNRNPFILQLLGDYKRNLDEKKINLDDDYIKFFRISQRLLDTSGLGIFGMITNNSFLDGLTHRQMRKSIGESYQWLSILNLHGSGTLGETCPDGSPDENVFDIRQGVGVTTCVKRPSKNLSDPEIRYDELWGLREQKYTALEGTRVAPHSRQILPSLPPYFFFVPKDFGHQSEYDQFWGLDDLFVVKQTGIKTDRDELFFDFDKLRLEKRIKYFYSTEGLKEPFRTEFRVEDSSSYKLLARRRATTFKPSNIVRCLYRPFDKRWLYYSPSLTSRPGYDVMRHMIGGRNIGLVTLRINGAGDEFVAFCSDTIIEKGSLPRGNYSLFPLYVTDDDQTSQKALGFDSGRCSGFSMSFLDGLSSRLRMDKGSNGLPVGLTQEDIFQYVYAVLYSPRYRGRYSEFLKIGFPRVPLTGNAELFQMLARLGRELIGVHLLESPKLDTPTTRFIGATKEVSKAGWTNDHGGTVWIDAGGTKGAATAGMSGFQGVPEAVWNFHIGGYQVCEKWLKARKGRTLSQDDISHYHKIVVALSETIRLMAEIDKVIEQHGGWPGAFAVEPESDSLPASPQVASSETAKPKPPVTARRIVAPVTTTDLFATAPAASNDDDLPVRPARVADVDDLGSDELCAAIRQLFSDGAPRDRDSTIVELSRNIGYQRTGKNVRETLDNALRTSVRRGVLSNEVDGLQLAYRTVEEYEADARPELKNQFVSSLAGTTWVKRGDAVVAFARWLGFRRAGPKIAEVAASLINGLLREGRLEAQGDEIRRTKGGAS